MILIRVDANEQIGTGHVMRCLTVANEFANKGERVIFVSADHSIDVLIRPNGFDCICLNSDYSNLETEDVARIVRDYNPSLMIIDSYYVTNDYLSNLSNMVRTVYFDDFNSNCWNVNYLINYNVYAEKLDYSSYGAMDTRLLLSPLYAPLRNEFKKCRKHEIKEVTDVLVSAGGSDPQCVTEKIMHSICTQRSNIKFHFVVGALNPRLSSIRNMADRIENVVLHVNEKHMSDLMSKCDIAISAAGMTLYELCAAGLPTVTYTLADNQMAAAEQFKEQGLMLCAGDCRSDGGFIGKAEKCMNKLIDDIDLRKNLSTKMQMLVDGKGGERIVEALL